MTLLPLLPLLPPLPVDQDTLLAVMACLVILWLTIEFVDWMK